MKIANTQMNHQQLSMSQNSQAKVATTAKSTGTSTPAEPLMTALRDAQTQLSTMPDVDMDKVAEIKSAIKEGRIELNANELAQAMLKYHQR